MPQPSDTPRAAYLIVHTQGSEPARLVVAIGDCLLDDCGGREPPIPFCCRSAACGTCRVDVLEGAEHLSPPLEDELDVLAIYSADPARTRLACQARVSRGGVSIHVALAAN